MSDERDPALKSATVAVDEAIETDLGTKTRCV